ncbi:hypothetical protein DN730_09450 [Marinomonas piezotolerans]|uniref:Uncharacterized protein n=1 Tax=Marinomonas piezotolerans TaxID=2213058 RepID=A0A370UA21_9GAMM|nr:hypothetical protein [Marinomonas piezotolerans]RDL44603.1 hypothetical protein DN730_09450 [Marinomonas piezotolerans]
MSTTTDTTQQANIRSALGVTSDSDFRIDFSTASDDQSKKFLANSVAVQTMMDILTNAADSGTNIATNQQNIVTSLAETVATQTVPPARLASARIQEIVKSVVKTDTTKQSDLSNRLLNLNTEIQKIESAANIAAVNAQLKASEVVSQLIKKEHATVNPDTNVKKVLDSGIDSLSSNLTTRLNSSTVEFDIATITKQLVDAGTKATTTLNSTELDSEVSDAVTKSTLESITADNIWAGHFLSLSGKEGTETGRVIAFFDGSATDSQGSASLCYALNADNNNDDQASIVKGRWAKISKNTVQVSTDLGDFQIKAYKKAVITDDPDTTSVNEKNNYLGVGDGSVDTDTYGNFFFSSEAIDKDATWYSDFKSVTGGTESETWGLKKTVGTVPTTGDQCKTFDYGSFDNILMTNLGTLNPPK